MYEILLKQKYDVRLVGNIGNPILSEKRIRPKTFFIVEASSYQLEYSRIFKSKYAAVLNISPDHIERHRTFKKYIAAKLPACLATFPAAGLPNFHGLKHNMEIADYARHRCTDY